MGDQTKIWQHFQVDQVSSFKAARPRLDHLAQRVMRASRPGSRVLTVGVGDGYLERVLRARGYVVMALDPIGAALGTLLAGGVPGCQGLLESIPVADGAFDAVVASEVLEHLTAEQGSEALREITRVLTTSGWFLGTVPYQEDLVAATRVCPACGHVGHPWGHQRSFTREVLLVELSGHFTDVTISTRAFPDFHRRGVVNTAKSTTRWALGRTGMAIADPKLAFAARR